MFPPNDYKNNDKIKCEYFEDKYGWRRLEFRFKKIDEARNYLFYEIKHNDLTSGKYKKTCKYLNYVENLLISVSSITGCVSISAFSSAGINICAIVAGIKKYNSTIKKKKKKHDKIVLLEKDQLNTIDALISKSLIDLYISHDEFVSVNNLLREYNEMKSEIEKPETSLECTIQKWLI